MANLLLNSNALHIPLADKSVHCIVTSPPYFNQRDYGTGTWSGGDINCDHLSPPRGGRNPETAAKQLTNTGTLTYQYSKTCMKCGATREDSQLGQEETHDCLGWATGDACGECYICHIRECARELYRVLRDDGTLWLNIGDSHNGSGGAGGDYNEHGFRAGQKRYSGTRMDSVKPKSLLMIPSRLAIALERDGWYLRAGIPWIKRNAYVEGVFDRPTTKMEYIYMLTKSRRYYYDHIAVRKEYKGVPKHEEEGRNIRPQDWFFDSLRAILNGGELLMMDEEPLALVVNTESSGVPHYATFPPALVRPFILASTSEMGVCKDCGSPIERITEHNGKVQQRRQKNRSENPYREGNMANVYKTTGYRKTCDCATQETTPPIVFDPFIGSGTTCIVAEQLGRNGIGMDLSSIYLRTAQKRLRDNELPMLTLLNEMAHE